MSAPSKAIRKYLAGYAEPEARGASALAFRFGHALVIPSYAEAEAVLDTLDTVPEGPRGPVLTLLVVNEPAEAPALSREANRRTFDSLEQRYGRGRALHSGMRLREHPRGWLLSIDRTGERAIPKKQGVGLARKIGLDVALAAAVRSKSGVAYLHSTDADVHLPADYLAAAEHAQAADGLVYPFRHLPDPETGDAIFAYEASLRYYVAGLRYAGSRYAFHTIGSLLAVSLQGYAAVRGVPKRCAAEDFYLLNKLRKVGPVRTLGSAPLLLSGRASSRVPFGTGPAVSRAADMQDLRQYPVYHPAIFERLRRTLRREPGLDGFQTLKLVHALRDAEYPNQPLQRALRNAPFLAAEPPEDVAAICRQLAALEETGEPAGPARGPMPSLAQSVFGDSSPS